MKCGAKLNLSEFSINTEPLLTISSEMIVLITLLLFAIPILCNKVELRSPRVTTFGDWNSWARCRDGEFAYAIQVKVEGKQGSRGDDTGLNAVALYCRPLGSGQFDF